MRAYVLCGGRGTRLESVIHGGQKTLIEVDGRHFLSLVLEQLKLAGIEEAVLCAGHRAELITAALPQLAAQSGLRLHQVTEPTPLGTGGALLNALHHYPAQQRYIVLNADTFLESVAYSSLAQLDYDAILTIHVPERQRFGALICDAQGKVLALHEKGLEGAGWINGGVYTFAPAALARLPVAPCSIEHDLLPHCIAQGTMYALPYSGIFHDIGTPQSLAVFLAQTDEHARTPETAHHSR